MISHAQAHILMSWGPRRRRSFMRCDWRSLGAMAKTGVVRSVGYGEWELTMAGVLARGIAIQAHDHGRLLGRIDSQNGGPELLNVTAEVRHRHPILCGAWPPPESEERKAS